MMFAIGQGVVTGAMYGLFALGIVLVYRGTKVINFAAPAIGSLGLFIAHELHVERGTTWITGAVAGLLVAAAVALLFELLIVRRMHDATPLAVAVATIGLMLLIISTELVVFGGSPRNLPSPIAGSGFTLLGVTLTPVKILSIVVAVLIGVSLAQFLKRTDFGLGVQAAAMDSQAVRLVGVRLHDVNRFVWVVGGMIAVVAALLVLPSIGAFLPGSVTKTFFVPALAAALIGGLDDLGGVFVGGLVVGLIIELSKFAFLGTGFAGPEYLAVLLAIVAVLLLAPNGVPAKLRAARKVGA
jgi:branched-chain amino acid transport system permease protein